MTLHNKSKFDSDLPVKMCRDMMSIKIEEYRKEESEKRGEERCVTRVKRSSLQEIFSVTGSSPYSSLSSFLKEEPK